jgi:hypothetical protein
MADVFIAEPIIYGLDNELYHRGEGYDQYLSSTQIKDFLVSPKYAKYKQEHPEEFVISDDALEFGSMYHAYLESLHNHGDDSEFAKQYHVFDAPVNEKTGKPYGRDTQKYIAALEQTKSEHPDWIFVSEDRVNLVKKMATELLNNCGETSKQVRTLLRQGQTEVSHFVEYDGCKFKFRPDLETKRKIVDWKTTVTDSLHPSSIAKTITKFGYGISAAFYQFFEHEQSGVWKDFYWVFQQKTPPYDAVMVSAEQWAYSYNKEYDMVSMGPSALLFKKLLDQYIECKKSGIFPGAEVFIEPGFRGHRIMSVDAPTFNSDFRFYNKNE